MRSPAGAAVVLLSALVSSGCAGSGGVAASCVGPQVALTPAEAAVGERVTVTVEWLREGCNDYTGADEERASVDVPVSFVQGDTRVHLGAVSGTGDRFSATLTATVPADGAAGPAEVVVGDSATADLTVLP
jgi:hypothetical protein